jgi:hypothetical protein
MATFDFTNKRTLFGSDWNARRVSRRSGLHEPSGRRCGVRKTTGLAWRIGRVVEVKKTGTLWDERSKYVEGDAYYVAAFDAPILPQHEGCPYRECEGLFYGGAFWNRCRPGLSHSAKRGLPFRAAGSEAASQFAALVSGARLATEIAVRTGTGIIEAFPNAFLGVLIPGESYE